MSKVTFISGNTKKAEFLAKYLGFEVPHIKLELDELQSLNLREITEHKARQAYIQVGSPVLVEDISFSLSVLGKLPGPFIKWFLQELGFEAMCRLADASADRKAVTEVCYAYFDGKSVNFFEGSINGTIPEHPRGNDGFGWNCIFIPEGQSKTNAEMSEKETERYSLRTTTVYPKLKKFLADLDKD